MHEYPYVDLIKVQNVTVKSKMTIQGNVRIIYYKIPFWSILTEMLSHQNSRKWTRDQWIPQTTNIHKASVQS